MEPPVNSAHNCLALADCILCKTRRQPVRGALNKLSFLANGYSQADVWPEFAGMLDARIPPISISSPVKVQSLYSRPKRKQNLFHSFAPRPPPCSCETF